MINGMRIQSLVLLEYTFWLQWCSPESDIMMMHRLVEMSVIMPLVAVRHARCIDWQRFVRSQTRRAARTIG